MFNKPFRVVAGSTLSGYWNGLNTEKGNMVHFTTIFRINKIFRNKGLLPVFLLPSSLYPIFAPPQQNGNTLNTC
jgi:hypothetical protein